jgi:hypothetical protein
MFLLRRVPAGLAPYYEHICGELGWDVKQDKLQEMQASNAKQLEELAAKIKVCALIRFGTKSNVCACARPSS